MSSVNIRSVSVLQDLKSVLARFGADTQTALQSAEQEVRLTETWLQERLTYWRTELQRRQGEVRMAEAALARCRASGYQDPQTGRYYQPSCTAEAAALQQAVARVQEAQTQQTNVQNWQRSVGQAATSYRTQAQQVNRLLAAELPKSASFLSSRIAALQAYLAAMFQGGVTAPGAPVAASSTSTLSSGLQTNAVRGPTGLTIESVPLDQIDLSDSPVSGAADFRKVSAQQMQDGWQKLRDVVAPAVAQGADGDYFARLDAVQGLSGANSYKNIYDVFYGTNCIALDQVGGTYHVTNGYHRLFIARQLGITTIPARIIGRRP